MANKSPAFQLYVQDFLSGVKLFTTEEVGAYILLLIEQWDTGYIQNDAKYLKKITGISAKKLQKILKKFQETEKGVFKNIRLEQERLKQIEWRNKSSMGGKKGAIARLNNKSHNSTTLQPPLQGSLQNGINQKATLHLSPFLLPNGNSIDATNCEEIKKEIKEEIGRASCRERVSSPV